MSEVKFNHRIRITLSEKDVEEISLEGHSTTIMKQLLQQQEKNESLCDVELMVSSSENRIVAHRAVLVAASPYFARKLAEASGGVERQEVLVKDVDHEVLLALVRFCYTGVVKVTADNVRELLKAADRLLLVSVVDACAKYLQRNLNPENVLGIAVLAEKYSLMHLLKAANACAKGQFLMVAQGEEFLEQSDDQIAELLKSDDLTVSSEEQVFHAMMNWIRHRPSEREKFFPKLLGVIRLVDLSAKVIWILRGFSNEF